jgi:hypothetical protein
MKQVLITLLITATVIGCYAQAGKEAMEVMHKLVDAYKPQSGITFDITYRYAMEQSPSVYLDSLAGQCKLMGDRYWYQLDQTQMIKTSDYQVIVYSEDEIIYLAKPSKSIAENPMAMIDSLLFQRNDISFEVANEKQWQRLVLNFPASSAYKKIEYRVDKQSGLLITMTSTVRNELMSQSPANQSAETRPGYAVVEARFSNYRLGQIDEKIFDTGSYVTKIGADYKAVAPYEQYKIFLGSQGM